MGVLKALGLAFAHRKVEKGNRKCPYEHKVAFLMWHGLISPPSKRTTWFRVLSQQSTGRLIFKSLSCHRREARVLGCGWCVFSVKATLWDPQILSWWFITGWISAKGSWCFAVPLDPRFSPRQVARQWWIRNLETGKTADPSSSCCPSRLWFGPVCSAATSACWFCIPWLLWKIPLNLQLQNPWLLCAVYRF